MRDLGPAARRGRLVACVLGGLAVAVAEGGQATFATSGASLATRVEMGAVAAAAVALPAIVVAIVGALVLELCVSVDLRERLAGALGLVRGEGRGAVIVGQLALLGVALTRLGIVGRKLGGHMSPPIAATATVLVTAAGLAALVAVCAAIAPVLRRLPVLARSVWPSLGESTPRRCVFVGAVTLVCAVSLEGLLPSGCLVTPTVCAVAVAVLCETPISAWVNARLAGPRGVAACAAVCLAGATSPWMFGRLPVEGKLGVLDHAPIAALLLTAAQPRTRAAVPLDWQPVASRAKCDEAALSTEEDEGVIARPEDPRRPNLVLIHLDALRPDHLGFAGYARRTSPVLDRFREGAVWFRNAYTPAPGTRFALASVFTGLDLDRIPQRRGAGYAFDLLPAASTLAEQLRDIGYDRVGLTISLVTEHSRGMGQGFRIWQAPWPSTLPPDEVSATSATRTTDAALRYAAEHEPGSPFLLFAHYQCTHEPYVKHLEWDFGESDVDVYDSALAYCDHEIGRLLDTLDVRPDAAQTAVVLYSDHGELFGEHGFHEHGNTLFEPDVRVLLLVRPPAAIRTAGTPRTVTLPVSIVDVTPTLTELAGAPCRSSEGGTSLVPLLVGPGDPELAKRPIFLFADLMRPTLRYQARGVVKDGFKYIRYEPTGLEQLFDLSSDPQESHNLTGTQITVRERLASLVDADEAGRAPAPLSCAN
jgi:arylsulfatase A-like enzyme